MLQKRLIIYLTGILLLSCMACFSQSVDSAADKLANFPTKLFSRIRSKTSGLDRRLTQQTENYLRKMAKDEQRIRRKLYATDSNAAKTLFAGSAERYASLEQQIRTDTAHGSLPLHGPYMSYVDSLKTSLSFLQKNPQLISSSDDIKQKLQASVTQFQQLQAKMQDAEEVQQFLQQRKAQISQYFSNYTQLPSGVSNYLDNYKQQAYYYSHQVQAYKDELNDPDKLLQRGLQVLDRIPAFTSFVKKNSMLACLVNIPSTSPPSGTQGLGMPSRDAVMSAIPGATGANGANVTAALQQNVQSAQSEVDQLRNKLKNIGSGSADLDIPDFQPNDQKTRSFLRRLQFGANLQSEHSTPFFPTTTDLGLSAGYKLNSKNIIGVGASYKIGWGKDIKSINITGQGIGLRSFLDVCIHNTWYASGGFEYNYQQPFNIQGLPANLDSWQKSGLIGISKIVSMRTRVFKNTKLQLLWDFLSYQQKPQAQALKFRIGYDF